MLTTYCLAAFVLVAIPGPDLLFVIATAVSHGRRGGLAAAAGFATGVFVHVALVIVGVAALVRASPGLLVAVRLCGAAYLVWIGVAALRALRATPAKRVEAPPHAERIFHRAVVANVCNPKVTLFFVSFLPQFVDPAGGAEALQLAILGVIFQIETLVVFGAVALLAAPLGDCLRRGAGQRAMQLVTGMIFVGLGVWLAAGA